MKEGSGVTSKATPSILALESREDHLQCSSGRQGMESMGLELSAFGTHGRSGWGTERRKTSPSPPSSPPSSFPLTPIYSSLLGFFLVRLSPCLFLLFPSFLPILPGDLFSPTFSSTTLSLSPSCFSFDCLSLSCLYILLLCLCLSLDPCLSMPLQFSFSHLSLSISFSSLDSLDHSLFLPTLARNKNGGGRSREIKRQKGKTVSKRGLSWTCLGAAGVPSTFPIYMVLSAG